MTSRSERPFHEGRHEGRHEERVDRESSAPEDLRDADGVGEGPPRGPTPAGSPGRGDGGGRPGPLSGETSRLHPAALAIWILRSAGSLVIVLVVTGAFGPMGLGFLAILAAGLVVRYYRFRWRLDPDAVVIDEGFIVRKRRVIRRDRIQTVDLERGILHRLLGVVEVRIEAVGAGGTEGKLAAVAPELAEGLRRTLLSRAEPGKRGGVRQAMRGGGAAGEEGTPVVGTPEPGGTPGAPAGGTSDLRRLDPDSSPPEISDTVLARVPPESLMVAGLTGGRVGVAAALVGFLLQTVPEAWWADRLGVLLQQAPDPTSALGVRVFVVVAIFVVLASFFLSVVATVFTHWEFTLSEGEGMLGVRRGLFTEHRDSVPHRRIQAVRIEENVLRRLLRRGSLRAVVAGRVAGQGTEGTDLLLPIGSREEVHRLARRVVGLGDESLESLRPMPRRAGRRRMTRAFLAAGAIGGGAAVLLSLAGDPAPWRAAAWFGGVTLAVGLLLAVGAFRALGWADLGTHVVVREGVLNRKTTIVPVDRLQVLETSATPFQRIARLATLHLMVARPLTGATPRALDLPAREAEVWQEALAGRLARRTTGSPPGARAR